MDATALPAYGFRSLEGQTGAVQVLEGMLRSRRLPQGLLFSGMPGCGRGLAARTLMMQANCRDGDPPCGRCTSCRRILEEKHPDFIRIQPANGMIRIESVRDLTEKLMRRPHEADRRFVVMEDAETLNREAANALLKILEEPPDATHFILLSSRPQWMLETIRSRCQEISFIPLSTDLLARQLLPMAPDAEAAFAAARLACGNAGSGRLLAGESGKRRVLARILAQELPLTASKAMALAEWLAPDRAGAEILLHILEGLLRDICLAATDRNVVCTHGISLDCLEDLLAAGKKISADHALSLIDRVREIRRRLTQNALPRLQMEAFFLQDLGAGIAAASPD